MCGYSKNLYTKNISEYKHTYSNLVSPIQGNCVWLCISNNQIQPPGRGWDSSQPQLATYRLQMDRPPRNHAGIPICLEQSQRHVLHLSLNTLMASLQNGVLILWRPRAHQAAGNIHHVICNTNSQQACSTLKSLIEGSPTQTDNAAEPWSVEKRGIFLRWARSEIFLGGATRNILF